MSQTTLLLSKTLGETSSKRQVKAWKRMVVTRSLALIPAVTVGPCTASQPPPCPSQAHPSTPSGTPSGLQKRAPAGVYAGSTPADVADTLNQWINVQQSCQVRCSNRKQPQARSRALRCGSTPRATTRTVRFASVCSAVPGCAHSCARPCLAVHTAVL